MKKSLLLLMFFGYVAFSTPCTAAMSTSRVRTETRFLTDKMAYELRLNDGQYSDVYEINFDFIYSIRRLMDDVVRGREWALDRYYHELDLRNDDLRYVLSERQYRRFLSAEYFYRPVYTSGRRWNFRIYVHYTNPHQFYFGCPAIYKSYCGAHHRDTGNRPSYYSGRYNHTPYRGEYSVRSERVYDSHRRSDFGEPQRREQPRRENQEKVRESRSERRSTGERRSESRSNGESRTGSRSNESRASERRSNGESRTGSRTSEKRSNESRSESRTGEKRSESGGSRSRER